MSRPNPLNWYITSRGWTWERRHAGVRHTTGCPEPCLGSWSRMEKQSEYLHSTLLTGLCIYLEEVGWGNTVFTDHCIEFTTEIKSASPYWNITFTDSIFRLILFYYVEDTYDVCRMAGYGYDSWWCRYVWCILHIDVTWLWFLYFPKPFLSSFFHSNAISNQS